MASEYIRILNGPTPKCSTIEAGPSAWPAVVSPEIIGKLNRAGYTVSAALISDEQIGNSGPQPWRVEVRPPFSGDAVNDYVIALHGLAMLPLRSRDILITDERSNESTVVGCILSRENDPIAQI